MNAKVLKIMLVPTGPRSLSLLFQNFLKLAFTYCCYVHNFLLAPYQFGFQKGICTGAVFDYVKMYVVAGNAVAGLFFDVTEAFYFLAYAVFFSTITPPGIL